MNYIELTPQSCLAQQYDAVVVGAGLSGATLAQCLASQGKRVWVMEQRDHIAGNCYDYAPASKQYFIHRYGPHIFHTQKPQVIRYLSQFTQWEPYQHQVQGWVDGRLVDIPFNLNSLQQLLPQYLAQQLTQTLVERYGFGQRIAIMALRKDPDPQVQFIAQFIYDKIFVNYTSKQWGCTPDEIDEQVTARVPIVLSKDPRYFHDRYQMLPKQGYTAMVEAMLTHPLIDVQLGVDAMTLLRCEPPSLYLAGQPFKGIVIYTGAIDHLFNYSDGELPYQSLKFELCEYAQAQYQPVATVNYPNDYDFTRITEFKHFYPHAQHSDTTVIVREYPGVYQRLSTEYSTPYYPKFTDQARQCYQRYADKAQQCPNLYLAGRLAQYRYYNMDDAVLNALECFTQQIQPQLSA